MQFIKTKKPGAREDPEFFESGNFFMAYPTIRGQTHRLDQNQNQDR